MKGKRGKMGKGWERKKIHRNERGIRKKKNLR
jgi:hypothetical protein